MSNILHSQEAPEAVLAHVASNLRALRKAAGLSQQEVADRAGLSRRMLVALEGGDTNISLARLSRVAAALGVSFARIVQPTESAERPTTTVWQGQLAGSTARFLDAAACAREVEFWSWSIAPGDRYVAEADPPGYSEALLVVEGTLTLEFVDREEIVPAGGFTRYPSDQSYAYGNRGPGPLRFLRTVLF